MQPSVGADFGAYRITKRIGTGGMGAVFAAIHRELDREVALKLLAHSYEDDEAFRNRFRREAQALGRLDHESIVRIYDAGEVDGVYFFATQIYPEGDLGQLLAQHSNLEAAEAVALVAEVAQGLAHAHARGILHRDIKPSNVLITTATGTPRAVLADFGISRMVDSNTTKTGGVIGTLTYMAPERHLGHEADVSSDVYALGCLLFACLTGAPPYEGTDMHVAMGHVSAEIPNLPDSLPQSAELNEVLHKALAKDPAERYASAQLMAEALIQVNAKTSPLASGEQDLLLAVQEGSQQDDLVVETPDDSSSQTVVRDRRDPQLTRPREESAVGSVVRPARASTPNREIDDQVTPSSGRRWQMLFATAVIAVLAAFGMSKVLGPSGGADATGPNASPEATVNSSSPSVAAQVTCWDGKKAGKVKECSPLTGLAGARHLFDFEGAGSKLRSCEPSKPLEGVVEGHRCRLDGDASGTGYFLRWERVGVSAANAAPITSGLNNYETRNLEVVKEDQFGGERTNKAPQGSEFTQSFWRVGPSDDRQVMVLVSKFTPWVLVVEAESYLEMDILVREFQVGQRSNYLTSNPARANLSGFDWS